MGKRGKKEKKQKKNKRIKKEEKKRKKKRRMEKKKFAKYAQCVLGRCPMPDFDLTNGLWIAHHNDEVYHTCDNAVSQHALR